MIVTWFEKARILRDQSRFAQAARLYRTLLKRKGLSILQAAEAHLGAADSDRLQGNFPASKANYRKARKFFQAAGSPRTVDAEAGWALAARASGEPRLAVRLLRRCLAFYQVDGDLEGEAFARWALGGALRIAGDMREGWSQLQRALALYRRLGDSEGEGYTHCALGGLARMRGRWADCAVHYRAANKIHRRRHDPFGTAYSYCGLGNVQRMAGRWDGALRFFRKAEKLYKRIGDKVSYAYTLWSIGTAEKMKGNLKAARHSFATADKLFQQTGDDRGRAYVFLGYAELDWLQFQDGEKSRHKALAFARGGGYAWEALHAKVMKGGKIAKDSRSHYAKAGSRFYPKGMPLNWP